MRTCGVGVSIDCLANLTKTGLKEIEYFNGPHTINGQDTYKFLHKHKNWPKR